GVDQVEHPAHSTASVQLGSGCVFFTGRGANYTDWGGSRNTKSDAVAIHKIQYFPACVAHRAATVVPLKLCAADRRSRPGEARRRAADDRGGSSRGLVALRTEPPA